MSPPEREAALRAQRRYEARHPEGSPPYTDEVATFTVTIGLTKAVRWWTLRCSSDERRELMRQYAPPIREEILLALPDLDPHDLRSLGWFNVSTAVALVEIRDPSRLSLAQVLDLIARQADQLGTRLAQRLAADDVQVRHRDVGHEASVVLPRWTPPQQPVRPARASEPSVPLPPPTPPPPGRPHIADEFVAFNIHLRMSEFRERRVKALSSDQYKRHTQRVNIPLIRTVVLSEMMPLKQEDVKVGWYNFSVAVVMFELSDPASEFDGDAMEAAMNGPVIRQKLQAALRSTFPRFDRVPCSDEVREMIKLDALPPAPPRPPEARPLCPRWGLRFGAAAGVVPVHEYKLQINVPASLRTAGRYLLSAFAKTSADYASAGEAPSRLGAPGQLLNARFWSKTDCTGGELYETIGGWPSKSLEWQQVEASYYALDAAVAPRCIEWYVGFPTRTARGEFLVTELQVRAPDGTPLLRDGNFSGGRGLAAHTDERRGAGKEDEEPTHVGPRIERLTMAALYCVSL